MFIVALPAIFVVVTLTFGVFYVLVDYIRILRLRQRMAPGPFPLPLFGNIFHIPSSRQWKKFEEWSLKYQSPIITIWDGHTPVVICNDAWSMSDLCDKRANIFSSRPVKTLTGKIFGLNKFNQAGLAYGEQWRVHRRLTHSAANAQVVQAYHNFAKRLLKEKEEHGLSKVEISNLTGNFIGAGVDTTTSTMLTFVLAMCLNQDVQSKAHEEIDRIVGRDRYPDWSDEDSLTYLAAVINETLRWRPAFALGGPPHAPTEDEIYNGFFFPRGTSIIGNLYAMHRNPREFPQPHRFWPERFMESFDGPAYPNKRGHNTFGWGRRVCSGEALAQQSLYFTIVSLLWAFEIRPGVDEKGNEVVLDPDAYTVSQVNRPLPFKVRFLARSETIATLVRTGAQEARTQLRAYDAITNVTFESAQSVSLDMPIAQAEKGSIV
ncbi:hypothetical protein CTAM01_01183 [Colletotrichum tamarilloi]|uniref:Cytochrome P450 n=1 Tax=Colletotrichum tamarilloi TaxID=1209934 RepID=A0ABQ9RQE7_9PEZI|nr:uncharacterized protein CTAM01_01183 [Colletotrichum tamarilloi]KAK1510610.1 hypothetical protein CTAM01_01183 [Colletotrichum tamarilloi]